MIPREIQTIIDASDFTPEEWQQVVHYFQGDWVEALAQKMFRMTAGDTIEHSVYEGKLTADAGLHHEHRSRARLFAQRYASGQEIDVQDDDWKQRSFYAALQLGAVNRADSVKLRQEGKDLAQAKKH